MTKPDGHCGGGGMHACGLELVPGVTMVSIGVGERLVLSALRLISSGQASCGAIHRVFDDMLGPGAPAALDGLGAMAASMPGESTRALTLGAPCTRGVTWDEAAILGLVEAAQRSDVNTIRLWFDRLGIDRPSCRLQRSLAWLSGAMSVSSCRLQPRTAELTACTPPKPRENSGVDNCK